MYRGAFDPDAPGRLRWEVDRGLPKTGRLVCLTVCDGRLFVAGGPVENNGETPARGRVTAEDIPREGGLYRRLDGPKPSWELLYRWAVDKDVPQSRFLRGLTAVPGPKSGTHQVLLAAFEYPGVIRRFGPTSKSAF